VDTRSPQIDVLVREVARARDFRTPHALAEELGVSWNTIGDLWHRHVARIGRDMLASLCSALSCEPRHLLRLVDVMPPADQLRQIDPLPPQAAVRPQYRVVLRFRQVAEEEYHVSGLRAFARYTGVSLPTATLLWHDQSTKVARATLARAVSKLGGNAAIGRLIVVEPALAPVADSRAQKAGLVASQ
jgi:DNA-binding Xre family transcriptional regulator